MEINFYIFIIVGFMAQMIDGSLGMAYGVSANSFLLAFGLPPAAASASLHLSEIFTTAASGLSHLKFKNVNKALFKKLIIPGVIGGALGAYVLTSLPGDKLKPYISFYLILMGLIIIWKAFKKNISKEVTSKLFPLGLIGGFFDAIGGGGWGPIVTTTLVARGQSPKQTIGSVNLTEFFVTVSESVVFILTLSFINWQIILGLIIGGVIAAPLAAYFCNKLPSKSLMIMVGLLIIFLSVKTLLKF